MSNYCVVWHRKHGRENPVTVPRVDRCSRTAIHYPDSSDSDVVLPVAVQQQRMAESRSDGTSSDYGVMTGDGCSFSMSAMKL